MAAERPTWPARVVAASGRGVAWLTLLMVCLTFAVVVMRYGFSLGWVWLQEAITYMHASVFMLAAAWTLQCDGHVRVDIFYREATPRRRAWVNLGGLIMLLLPFCLFLLMMSWDYVFSSWQLFEGSREAGGLPLVYLLKSLLMLMPLLLLLQAVPMALANLRVLRGVDRGDAVPGG